VFLDHLESRSGWSYCILFVLRFTQTAATAAEWINRGCHSKTTD